MRRLALGRDLALQAAVVEPVDVAEGGELDGVEAPPRALGVDEFPLAVWLVNASAIALTPLYVKTVRQLLRGLLWLGGPFEITTNRESRPGMIAAANGFVSSVEGRLDKQMGTFRPASGGDDVIAWPASRRAAEAGWVANLILDTHDAGVP